ncbi:MAG: DUF418 domain-containing protein [Planctomycetota bacterium]
MDAEGRPRRASDRIGLDIDVRVDRERHEAAIVDARRLRRYLAATRERHAWAEMDLGVVPREDGEGVAIVLAVAEDPASELAPGSEERFRSLASGLAAWMGDRAGPPFGGAEDASLFGSSPDWPGALERLVLRRRVPTRDEAGREDLLGRDEAVVDLAAARALDRRDLRLLDQAHATSWPNPSPFYVLAALGLSGVVLGGCLLLARARILAPAIAPLAAAGRTALTLYLAHILLGIWLLRAIGKGSGEDLRFIAFAVGTCVWVAISGAAYWCRLFRVGPLEWLMRRLAP